ncbi:MAG: MFS transporter, partial [Acidobacteria bacterium]|nr:MFS transporter [Acidobacteriota bacterium]
MDRDRFSGRRGAHPEGTWWGRKVRDPVDPQRDEGDVEAGDRHADGTRQLPWRLRLTNAAFDIRPGEGPIAWLFFLYFLLLATCHYVGKSVRNATYIDTVGATRLPYVYLLVAVASVPVLLAYSRLTVRARQDKLIVGWSMVQAAGLAVFYQLYVSFAGQAWVAVAFYVWLTIGFGVAVSQLWLFASQVFDPRQARRLFGFVGAGGLAGGVVGGQLARVFSHWLGTHATLLVAAALMLGVGVIISLTERARRRMPALARDRRPERLRAGKGGWAAVRSSRLLEMIALVMLLSVVVGQMVDLQFNWAIQRATTTLDQRTAVFGFFYSVMGLLAFLFQLFFTQRIHRRLGVGFAMRVMPTTVGLGTVALIAAATALPAVLLPAAWFLKLSESGLRHSLDQATRELLFVPVSQALRTPGKAFIDVFVQRAAKGAAAVVLLTVTFGFLSLRGVSWLTLALVMLWIVVVASTHREYVATFRRGLKSEVLGQPAPIQLQDVETVTKLVEHLGSSDPRLVTHSLELLATHGHHRLVPPLLLHHHDAGVRRMTLRLLAEDRRSEAVPLVEMVLEDPEPEVRREAVHALAAIERREAARVMVPRLDSPHPNIRAAAAADLAVGENSELAARALAVLGEMAVDADPRVRAEAARAVARLTGEDSRELVVQLLYDGDLGVVREAVRSAGRRVAAGEDTPIFV